MRRPRISCAQVLGPLQDEGDVLRSKAAEITLLDVLVTAGIRPRRFAPKQLLQAIKPAQETPRRTPAS